MGNLKCVSLREKGGSLQLLVVPDCHLLEGGGWGGETSTYTAEQSGLFNSSSK